MGHELCVYGMIYCMNYPGDDFRRLKKHNALILRHLPEEDDEPFLVRSQFSLPGRHPYGTYVGQVIHFGATMRDDWLHHTYINLWIEKFERLLRRLYWLHATAHIETEFEPEHTYNWLVTGDTLDGMRLNPPLLPQVWTRELEVNGVRIV